ncbi:MAG: hypothetical protein HC822_20425 [Oscillochloris sp.]|nr:hypothetical protein [Oscillochloris sp.]
MGLSLAFLGTFHVQHNNSTVTCFRVQSARALLAYLAIESDRPHERAFLANLLWPDTPLEQALTLLRQTIHRLRSVLSGANENEYFEVTRYTIRLRPDLIDRIDLRRFETLVERTRYRLHETATLDTESIRWLQEAVNLYRGEVLAGFSGMGSPPFEEWLLLLRERMHNRHIQALDLLSEYYQLHANLYCAGEYLRHWLVLEPWRELVHRRLMQVLAEHGRRDEALRQYATCCEILRRELGLEPSLETIELAESVRNDTLLARTF